MSLTVPESLAKSGTGTCPLKAFRLPDAGYKNHPGGQLHLNSASRSECPGLLFLSYHLGTDLKGKVASSAKAMGVAVPEYGPFYEEVQEATRKICTEHAVQRRVFKAWCLTILASLCPIFIWFELAPSLASALATTFIFEVYFLNVFHTRHHKGGRLFESDILHRVTTPLCNFVDRTWGYKPEAWWRNHHLLHHIETNAHDSDPDVPASYPMIRTSPLQPRLWFHMLQTFYWPLLLPFSVARFPVDNVTKHGAGATYFCMWVLLMFVLPWAGHGTTGLAYAFLVMGLTGVNITYKFAVSHTHPELGRTEPAGKLPAAREDVDKWMAAQVEESTSWGGYWSTLVFGGINMQIEHHLGPALEPPLYHFLAPELRRICGKHGVRYTAEPSLFHAVFKFHARLWEMGLAD